MIDCLPLTFSSWLILVYSTKYSAATLLSACCYVHASLLFASISFRSQLTIIDWNCSLCLVICWLSKFVFCCNCKFSFRSMFHFLEHCFSLFSCSSSNLLIRHNSCDYVSSRFEKCDPPWPPWLCCIACLMPYRICSISFSLFTLLFLNSSTSCFSRSVWLARSCS